MARKFIYIICPYKLLTEPQRQETDDYIKALEEEGHYVHSYKTVNQDDPTGYEIYQSHAKAMTICDEVHIFWDTSSTGSHVDLGMAIALKKPLLLVNSYQTDKGSKSYLKIIKEIGARGYWDNG